MKMEPCYFYHCKWNRDHANETKIVTKRRNNIIQEEGSKEGIEYLEGSFPGQKYTSSMYR